MMKNKAKETPVSTSQPVTNDKTKRRLGSPANDTKFSSKSYKNDANSYNRPIPDRFLSLSRGVDGVSTGTRKMGFQHRRFFVKKISFSVHVRFEGWTMVI